MAISFQVSLPPLKGPFEANVIKQVSLALNISETIINLHRPYYAKHLYDDIDDSVASTYAPSYLSVVERCAVRTTWNYLWR